MNATKEKVEAVQLPKRVLCVRCTDAQWCAAIKATIATADLEAVFDPEGNPVTFWVTTKLPLALIRQFNHVESAITGSIDKAGAA
jgi:hypothetical protein